MGPFSRVRSACIALAAGVLAVAGAAVPASATVQTIAVPFVTAAPDLDPQAPLTSWPQSGQLAAPWDVVHTTNASEPTTVRVATDGKMLFVRFDATQREPAVATQHSNDTITGGSQGNNNSLAWSNDDAVWVDLWPAGAAGFQYQFEANAIGSHNEASSENSAFAPQWESHGAIHDGGYTVTMAIPLRVVHGAKSGAWRAQFIRYIRATGSEYVWSFDAAQTSVDDISRAGTLTLTVTAKAAVPEPRVAVYGLGALAAPSAGGNTSRVGADVSLPVTPTAALFAAFHPDYSNVELDQQTISPSVYQRQYSEVRPFFTQAASYYNTFNCNVCSVYHTILYTPAIPTFSQGYAFEGKQGDIGFAGFDAIGTNRNDSAAALDYTSPNSAWHGSFEHAGADLPGIVDQSNEVGWQWSDLKYLSAYVNYSAENGTLVSAPGQAAAWDFGGGYGDSHTAIYGALRSVGAQFEPVDGYVAHAGVAGYAVYAARILDFAPQDTFLSTGLSLFVDRYQGPIYGQSQSDTQLTYDLLTKSAWDFETYTGSDYWRFGSALVPVSQNGGFVITYHSGLQTNNPGGFPGHGTSAFPTQINFATGRYGAGRLDTWLRTSTVKAGQKGTITFTVDDTAQWMPGGANNIQWFDGLAYSYQVSPTSSFAIGLRKVNGLPPEPNGGGDCIGTCANVSLAYHLRLKHEEFYLAYGNPNTLSTVPQALLKVIFYFGGEKGT